jgi:hypothetical protein
MHNAMVDISPGLTPFLGMNTPDDQDHEANLFSDAPEHVRSLFKEAKKVRRLADRKSWWNARQSAASEQPPAKSEE